MTAVKSRSFDDYALPGVPGPGRRRRSQLPKHTGECVDVLFLDDCEDLELLDTRNFTCDNTTAAFEDEDLPSKIAGTYTEDYNILYIHDIICKKLRAQKFSYLRKLREKCAGLERVCAQPQTHLSRQSTLEELKQVRAEIEDINSGSKLKTYNERVQDILSAYRKHTCKVKTMSFDLSGEEIYQELDDAHLSRIAIIEKYLEIAGEYMSLDIIRINTRPPDMCGGCGISLAKISPNEEGTIRCPNPECQTEHNTMILVKLAKDGDRINMNSSSDDESIDNFLRALSRYCGVHNDAPHADPNDELYHKLDEYFTSHGRVPGTEIRTLPLTNRGRRGDTDHKMLLTALGQIGRSDLYEDANLIGNVYWGWKLPDVMHLRERIIEKYNKTQRVFREIPPEERCRTSSLGTQYRLWRHLQLEGHECYMDEFKIAENPDSVRNHHKLWRMMCEGAHSPDIFYIH